MSVEAMTWALRAPFGGTKKLLLVGLANHATAEFDHARPAVATLAIYAGVDERNVRKNLRALEADGWIERTGEFPVRGRRDRAVFIYRLCEERGDATVRSSANGGTPASERGDERGRNGGTPASPEPSLEPSLEPSERATAGGQTSLDVPEERVDAFVRWHRGQLEARSLPAPRPARQAARDLLRLAPGSDLREMFAYAIARQFWASKVLGLGKWKTHYAALRAEWLASKNAPSGRRNEPDERETFRPSSLGEAAA